MKRRLFGSILVLATAAAHPGPVGAQTAGTVDLTVPMVRNTAGSDEIATTQRFSTGGRIQHLFAGERGKVFYDSSFDVFSATGTSSTWLQNAGLVGTLDAGRSSIDLGASVFWRRNGGEWADAGFTGLAAGAAVEREFPFGAVSAGYTVHKRSFEDLRPLNQLEQAGHASIQQSFRTRTTLVASLAAGRKRYEGEALIVDPVPEVATGMQRGRGVNSRWTNLAMPAIAVGENSIRTRWTWSARVAQSLTDRTGVWLQYERRRTDGDTAPAVISVPPAFYDDGVYDDPYVADGPRWRAGVQHVFGNGGGLHLALDRAERDFTAAAVGDQARADVLTRAGWELTWPTWSVRAADFDLVAGYTYVQNRSTDPLYAYRSHGLAAGLRAGF